MRDFEKEIMKRMNEGPLAKVVLEHADRNKIYAFEAGYFLTVAVSTKERIFLAHKMLADILQEVDPATSCKLLELQDYLSLALEI